MKRRIAIVRPVTGFWGGNETTARRWAGILRALGYTVQLCEPGAAPEADLLVALHAVKSASSVEAFKRRWPMRPAVLTLTGTDLYPRLGPRAQRTVALADRLVVLHDGGLSALPAKDRSRARVIVQSARAAAGSARADPRTFDVGVIAHLRPVKDPLRTALAVRRLPPSSRLRVLHVGAPLDQALANRARAESLRNPRYRWLGPRTPAGVRSFLRRCRVVAVTSRREGGPNVISEALVAGVPVVATRIDGNVGLLGADYPGLVPVGDAAALRSLLLRIEAEPGFLAALQRACKRVAPRFTPEHEQAAWAQLLRQLWR